MLPSTFILESYGIKYILFDTKDLITHFLKCTGVFELELIHATERALNNNLNGIVLDIGANLGTYTIPLAKRNPTLEIISFEPQKSIFHQLCGNIAINSLDNVTAYNVAVGSKIETITLPMPNYMIEENVGGFSLDPYVKSKTPTTYGDIGTIDVTTIDNLTLDNVRLIKIDVEGLELDVIKGAQETILRSNYPSLIFESWTQHEWWDEKREELFSYVKDLGYEISSPYENNFLAVYKGENKQ